MDNIFGEYKVKENNVTKNTTKTTKKMSDRRRYAIQANINHSIAERRKEIFSKKLELSVDYGVGIIGTIGISSISLIWGINGLLDHVSNDYKMNILYTGLTALGVIAPPILGKICYKSIKTHRAELKKYKEDIKYYEEQILNFL